MEIWHTVSFPDSTGLRKKVSQIGILCRGQYLNFRISEGDPRWPEVAALIGEYDHVLDCCGTTFSPEELYSAAWLKVGGAWLYGYPQPEGGFGYLTETYNLSAYCASCGQGRTQKAPFRIRGEPKWGRRHFFQLNWVFDELFVRPGTWETMLRPLGIGSMPVLQHKTGRTLETVLQLVISEDPLYDLDLGIFPYEDCPGCGRRKYLPHTRGPFPRSLQYPPNNVHAIKSAQLFGSGAQSFRAVLVSQAVYRTVVNKQLKGLSFSAVAATSEEMLRQLK